MYLNDKIKDLIEKRNKLDSEINQEIERLNGLRKFDWKAFSLLLAGTILPFIMIKLNHMIFPPTSIWSWYYWIK